MGFRRAGPYNIIYTRRQKLLMGDTIHLRLCYISVGFRRAVPYDM